MRHLQWSFPFVRGKKEEKKRERRKKEFEMFTSLLTCWRTNFIRPKNLSLFITKLLSSGARLLARFPELVKPLTTFPALLSSFLGHRGCRGWREEPGWEEGLSDTHLCATSHRFQPRPQHSLHTGSRSSRCNAEPRDRIIRLSGVASAGPSPEPRGPRFL